MVPPAPTRGSTTICWPSASVSFGASSRAVISGAPPGAPNGSTKRMGFTGYCCALALAMTNTTAIDVIETSANAPRIAILQLLCVPRTGAAKSYLAFAASVSCFRVNV